MMVGAARDGLGLAPAAIAAGIVTDLLVGALRPSVHRSVAFRTVAFAVPASYYALFLATVAVTRGVWWTVPLWSGAVVLAGGVGWLLSWLLLPPPVHVGAAPDALREIHAAERHGT